MFGVKSKGLYSHSIQSDREVRGIAVTCQANLLIFFYVCNNDLHYRATPV